MSMLRGDLVLVACRNGVNTARILRKHLEEIKESRKKFYENSSGPYKTMQKQEIEFIEYIDNFGIDLVISRTDIFKDGEILPTLESESMREKDVFIVQNTLNPSEPEKTSDNIIELYLALDAARRGTPDNLTAVVPYLSYQKQEKDEGRQPISAKAIIDLIAYNANMLLTMDLHEPAEKGFSKPKEMKIENLYASSILLNDLINKKKFSGVFVSPDAGGVKMVGHYKKVTGLDMAVGFKYRGAGAVHTKEFQDLIGDVKNKDIAIIDDQLATGGTILDIAKVAKEKGANKVYAAVTHGMFLDNSEVKFRKAKENGTIDEIIITNTLIHSDDFYRRNKEEITVIDSLAVFAKRAYGKHTSADLSAVYMIKRCKKRCLEKIIKILFDLFFVFIFSICIDYTKMR